MRGVLAPASTTKTELSRTRQNSNSGVTHGARIRARLGVRIRVRIRIKVRVRIRVRNRIRVRTGLEVRRLRQWIA